VTVTGGLILLVYGLTRAPTVGWTSAETIASFAGFAVLMAAAIVIEQRSSSPLVDLKIFRRRTLTAANLIVGASATSRSFQSTARTSGTSFPALC
jgi:hypothetical protein